WLAYWFATSAERAVLRMLKRPDAMSHLPIDQDTVAPDVGDRLRRGVVAERGDGAAEESPQVLVAGAERRLEHAAVDGDLARDGARHFEYPVARGAEFVGAARAERHLEVGERDVLGAGERAEQRPATTPRLSHRAQHPVRGEGAAIDAFQVRGRNSLALVVQHLQQ